MDHPLLDLTEDRLLSMEKGYATQFLSLSSNLNYVLFDPTILQAFFASNNWVLALIMNVSTVTAHSTASIVFNGSHRSGVMDGNAFERNTKSTNWRFKERMYRTDWLEGSKLKVLKTFILWLHVKGYLVRNNTCKQIHPRTLSGFRVTEILGTCFFRFNNTEQLTKLFS